MTDEYDPILYSNHITGAQVVLEFNTFTSCVPFKIPRAVIVAWKVCLSVKINLLSVTSAGTELVQQSFVVECLYSDLN